MARMTIEFKGMEDLCKELEKMSSTDHLRKVADGAMKECFEEVQKDLAAAMDKSPYDFDRTGETKDALKTDNTVEWSGPTTGSIGVGFDITGKHTGHVGFPSIFLMHGAEVDKLAGTARIEPDRNLYNAIYGSKAKKKRAAICEQALTDALKQLKEG